nr:hypothetical protein [uncultured Ralstonia sp.]
MTSEDWWAEAVQTALSQGDIVTGLPLFSVLAPVPFLTKKSIKGGQEAWIQTEAPATTTTTPISALANGKMSAAIVLSHSCELDKKRNGARVLMAPVKPLGELGLSEEAAAQVLQQQVFALFPLPDVPGIGTVVADLRSTTSVPRAIVDDGTRIASMTTAALRRLAAQLVGFYLRLELPAQAVASVQVLPAE